MASGCPSSANSAQLLVRAEQIFEVLRAHDTTAANVVYVAGAQ
jgi:hypothetical protein